MGSTLELLLLGDELVAEGRFVALEVDRASKYAEVGKAWFSAIAVLEGCGWVTILVSHILGWASIDNADSIGMCMMEEGTAKSGSVEKYICSVVDFSPFGFTDAIHILVFWSSSFKFNSKVVAFCDEFCGCKGRSGISTDEADGLCAAK